MCGIAGILSKTKKYNELQYIQRMLSSLLHRGPDSSGIESLSGLGYFGHNRLAIIDLSSRASQPLWDEEHRYCLTFNGEIYNYLALKKELISLGHQFNTASDSEVLLTAWIQWGTQSIDRFIGMFAFAIWDKENQNLYLVRDRMGEKPLYYSYIHHDNRKGLIFASELKAILQYPEIKKNLSMEALNHYLSFGYTSNNACIFENIYKLSPAHFLVYNVQTGHAQIKNYWSLAKYFIHKQHISYKEAKEHLHTLLRNTVQEQMQADVPLGAFLSGGIDSTALVKHMHQINQNVTNTFSIGFSEKSYNESHLSQKTAKELGLHHSNKMIFPDVLETFPHIMKTFDEPFADSSLIPTYLLCQFAKQFVKVSLSGDGGDELFGGYLTYQADRYHQMMQIIPLSMRSLLSKASRHLPTSFAKVSWDYKIKQFLQGCLLPSHQAHVSWRELFSFNQKQQLFIQSLDTIYGHKFHNDYQWFEDVKDCHVLDQAMYVDMKTWLVDDILVKVDRTSMAHSLEVRSPFLDHRLVEFAASLPLEFKIRGRQGKKILKESHALPRHVLQHPKKGFNSPISQWLNQAGFETAFAATTQGMITELFNKKFIEQLWIDHKNRASDNGLRLFNLWSFSCWATHYL